MTATSTVSAGAPPPFPASGQGDFLRALFRELEDAGVRYCVLQRWDALEEELATDHDIDIAVPFGDAGRLPAVIGALARQGYQPIQLLNHAVHSYAVIFGWMERSALRTVMLDIAFEHRQCGLIWRSADELVAGRQKPGEFWVAAPEVEFAYLLVKKLLKDNWKAARNRRFRVLAERLGRGRAEAVIAGIFGGRRKRSILEACLNGTPELALRPLRRRFLWTALAGKPFSLARYAIEDGLRLGRRWLKPTGLTLAIEGGTAAGRRQAAARLADWLSPAFASVTLAPGCGAADRAPLRAARLWWAYWFATRPRLARTGLVILDDPQGGRLGPASNLALSLDGAAGDSDEMPRAAAPWLLGRLAERFRRQHAQWLRAGAGSADPGVL